MPAALLAVKKHPLLTILSAFAAAAALFVAQGDSPAMAEDSAPEKMLAHNVFFKLKESTSETREKLVAACHKYLSDHPGVVFYAAGPVVEELDRAVNDRDWDVGLHVVFKDKKHHDKYQEAPKHLQFIEENKETWAGVRVFDSYVSQP